ncbi:MAG: SAM-dependent methyltransferase [Oscillospiraceae bacterium]|nr:SAM-dependent methyltransferase [Oscillospiraceae bacterium]
MQDFIEEITGFTQATFSQPRSKGGDGKVIARRYTAQGRDMVQFEYHNSGKVRHENLPLVEAYTCIEILLTQHFRQALIVTPETEFHVTYFSKLKVKRTMKQSNHTPRTHDRERQTILRDGEPVPFLIELGVMAQDGHVRKNKMAKFRQINSFLELLKDGLDTLPKQPRIVDFGCGKSYLTFALQHYLQRGEIIGLDLKEDVIASCNEIAERLDCKGLRFQQGDIQGLKIEPPVDMVVSLHVCDTATDDALAKAVTWRAPWIYAAPCCQHELLKTMGREDMQFIAKHGAMKEKLASLLTDGLRAMYLEACGYNVTVCEFIESEHTPKNLLIKAQLTCKPDHQLWKKACDAAKSWGVMPHLQKELMGLGIFD